MRPRVDRVDRAIGRLALFPKAGRQPRDARLRRLGYRVLILDDYLIFYVIAGRTVQVRCVIHGARRYEFLLLDVDPPLRHRESYSGTWYRLVNRAHSASG